MARRVTLPPSLQLGLPWQAPFALRRAVDRLRLARVRLEGRRSLRGSPGLDGIQGRLGPATDTRNGSRSSTGSGRALVRGVDTLWLIARGHEATLGRGSASTEEGGRTSGSGRWGGSRLHARVGRG